MTVMTRDWRAGRGGALLSRLRDESLTSGTLVPSQVSVLMAISKLETGMCVDPRA